MNSKIDYYLKLISAMRLNGKHGRAKLYKPVLLLAVNLLARRKILQSNRISPSTSDLILLVEDIHFVLGETPNVIDCKYYYYPFFYMQSSPFWRLIPKVGMSILHSSFSALKGTCEHAEIDHELFSLMRSPNDSLFIEATILRKWFGAFNFGLDEMLSRKSNLLPSMKIETEMKSMTGAVYSKRMRQIYKYATSDMRIIEALKRSGVFQKSIPENYNYQCAISGHRMDRIDGATLVDACHILPFSVFSDDTFRNGIALSPSLHRAFDRGLIAIDENYRVRVHNKVVENVSPFSLKQFDQKKILLPANFDCHPSQENLKWHRENVFL